MNNLEVFKDMELYPIDRSEFEIIFFELFKMTDCEGLTNLETSNFKYWRFEDEFYFLHKPSGTLMYYYKHLGRSHVCNKILTSYEYKVFVDNFVKEIEEEFNTRSLDR